MLTTLKILIKHDGIQMMAMATLTAFLVMSTIPDPFIKMDNNKKKEYLKSRFRRLRRKSEKLFNLDPNSDECH